MPLFRNLKFCLFPLLNNGKYWIYHSRDFEGQDKLKNPVDQAWISIREACPAMFPKRYDKYLGYRLEEGDIIKFGRVRFKVK